MRYNDSVGCVRRGGLLFDKAAYLDVCPKTAKMPLSMRLLGRENTIKEGENGGKYDSAVQKQEI